MSEKERILGDRAPEEPWKEMIMLREKIRALEVEVKIRGEKIERLEEESEKRLGHLSKRPIEASVDWKLPIVDCPVCAIPLIAGAYDTGEGWLLCWECRNHCLETYPGEGLPGENGMPVIEWPFDQDYAYWFDMEHIGFEII